MQAGEDKRRELPEHVLGAQLAEPAAGEPAADGEGQRDELAREERRNADHRTDCEARVRAVDQAGQKCAFEREIAGLIPQEQARHHPQRQQAAEAQGEGEAVGEGRCSKIKKCRKRRNRTKTVAAAAITASFTSRVVSRNWSGRRSVDPGIDLH